MAGSNNSDSSDKKSSEAFNDIPTFSAENLQSNMKVIYYSRTFLSIIGGVIAGILGFTGLTGFILYFLLMAMTSLGLTAKAGFSIHSYFDSWNRVMLDGFTGGLMEKTRETNKIIFSLFVSWSFPLTEIDWLTIWCIYSERLQRTEQ